MSHSRCNLCDMKVLNMEVHMKLNHKKKKKEGFKYSGFSCSNQSPAPVPLPSITKYQNNQLAAEKVEKEKRVSVKKASTPEYGGNEEASSSNLKDSLQESLAMLSTLKDQETARKVYKLDDVNESELKDIFKSGTITREGFELKLKLLGLIRIGNSYKRKDEKYVKTCPDCGESFKWNRGHHKKSNLEYFEHIKTCGLGSNYTKSNFASPKLPHPKTKSRTTIPTSTILKQECNENPSEEICMNVKEEVDIKTEQSFEDETNIEIKTEPMDQEPIPITDVIIPEATVKDETNKKDEPSDFPNIEIKSEIVDLNCYETVSLELSFVNNTENSGQLFDNYMEQNAQSEVDDENNTPNVAVQKEPNNCRDASENLGDAWFKRISEIENSKLLQQASQPKKSLFWKSFQLNNKRKTKQQRKSFKKPNILKKWK